MSVCDHLSSIVLPVLARFLFFKTSAGEMCARHHESNGELTPIFFFSPLVRFFTTPDSKQLESQAKDQVNKAVDSANVQAGEIQKKVQNATGTGGAGGKIELYSPKYYATCAFGGIAACGTTHTLVTPLDLVKCRRQVGLQVSVTRLEESRR